MTLPPVHIITDDAVLARADIETLASALLRTGGEDVAFHLRGHVTSAARLHALAARLAPVARAARARFFVNDRVDIAMSVGADGVQLGRRSLDVRVVRALWPAACVGASVHSVAEAGEALAQGTDFVVLGTIYASATHPGRTASGAALIGAVRARQGVPVIAIGGITPERVAEVLGEGASGVAVRGAVWNGADPVAALGRILDAWKREAEQST